MTFTSSSSYRYYLFHGPASSFSLGVLHAAFSCRGKALGLAHLLTAGFAVPPGFCVTTEAYERAVQALDFSSAEQWQAALRSSGAERQRILGRLTGC